MRGRELRGPAASIADEGVEDSDLKNRHKGFDLTNSSAPTAAVLESAFRSVYVPQHVCTSVHTWPVPRQGARRVVVSQSTDGSVMAAVLILASHFLLLRGER